jgi:hypothetical protein
MAGTVIPSEVCREVETHYGRTLYKLRNRIERCFNQLKESPAWDLVRWSGC